MSFFSDPLRYIITKILPRDTSNDAGVGPFRLPDDAQWMNRSANIHDYDYVHSDDTGSTMRESEADFSLFWRWVLEAHANEDPMQRCHMARQICQYWPYVRIFGREFWKRNSQ